MLGFEESYVLTSADGLAYTAATPIPHTASPTDLLERARREREEARKNASLKSLREQLRENAEKADAEWKETHNPFMAPKGLDGEDMQWLTDEEAKRREKERLRHLQEERDRVQFEVAVARRKEADAKGWEDAGSVSTNPSLSFKGSAAEPLPSPSPAPLPRAVRSPSPLCSPPPLSPSTDCQWAASSGKTLSRRALITCSPLPTYPPPSV